MANVAKKLIELVGNNGDNSTTYNGTVTQVGSTYQVLIDGASTATTCATEVKAVTGDRVTVEIRNHVATVRGNITHPVTDDTRAGEAFDLATIAGNAATQAQQSAGDAATAASTAQSSASDAATAAANAASAAATADAKATDAAASAEAAASKADEASSWADEAQQRANDALSSATQANGYAMDALKQLSDVESVLDTVTWIAEHGSYVQTTDEAVTEGKAYYELVDGNYMLVSEPTDANVQNYYELVVDESLTNYVASHLALTDNGLWLLGDPEYTYELTEDVQIDESKTYYTRSGSGTELDPYVYTPVSEPDVADIGSYYEYLPTNPGYRTLTARDGVRVVDPSGRYVSTFGESIVFDSEREQRIGGDDAYIAWQDTDNDGVADSLKIVADSIMFRSGANAMSRDDVSQLERDVADVTAAVDEFGGYIRVIPEDATIELGRGDSPVKADLSDSKLDFSYNGDVAASIGVDDGNGTLFIDHAQVRTGGWIQLGSWQWVPRANGNVALKWVGA